MYRALLSLAVLVLVVPLAGCTMCAHPYDECGPTFTGGCGQSCDPDARAGSILASSTGSVVTESISGVEGEVISDEVISNDVLSDELTPVPDPGFSRRPAVPARDGHKRR